MGSKLPEKSAASSIFKICSRPRWSWESSSTWKPSSHHHRVASSASSRRARRVLWRWVFIVTCLAASCVQHCWLQLKTWINKNSIHIWIHDRNLSYGSFEFFKMNSYAIFHFWIQYHEFRILNSPWFSVMNSCHEFMFMKSDSRIQIWYYEFRYLLWIQISEFIYLWIQNLFIWMHIHKSWSFHRWICSD